MQNIWLWVVAAIIIIGGGFWLWQSAQPTAIPVDTGVTGQVPQTPAPSAAASAVVSYDGASFSPAEVTVRKGGTVTFTSTGANMWVASGPHPEHTGYDGTSRSAHCAAGAASSFDQCGTGASYSFTFDKAGTWPYHNHVDATKFGRVVVVE